MRRGCCIIKLDETGRLYRCLAEGGRHGRRVHCDGLPAAARKTLSKAPKGYGIADPAPVRKNDAEKRRAARSLALRAHLANMSFVGGEEAMVADGVVPACRLTLAHGKSAANACVQALYNLRR